MPIPTTAPAQRHHELLCGTQATALPDHPQVDLPEPTRSPAGWPGDPRPGATAGGRELHVGVPPGARRADPPRPPCQRGDGPADPPRPRLPARPARPGHLLADVP